MKCLNNIFSILRMMSRLLVIKTRRLDLETGNGIK